MSLAEKPSGNGRIAVALSQRQIEQVLRAAGVGASASPLTALVDRAPALEADVRSALSCADREGRTLSRSLLWGLLVLASFPTDGGDARIVELADELGMHNSTAHRYVSTLLAIGLLERDPATRRYRLARAHTAR